MSETPQQAVFQIGQKAILYDPTTKKFLLAKYAPPSKPLWSFIGGRIDEGETDLLAALDREIREEAGSIEYEPGGVVGIDHGGAIIRVGYLALYKGGDITLSPEHSEYAWFTMEEIEKHDDLRPEIKQFIALAAERLKERSYLDDLKRLQADFDNYKKRQATQQKELAGYLIENLVMDLVPVLDNFRSATEHVPEAEKGSPWVTGIQYIEKQLEKVLGEHGVETIAPKEGDAFDPAIHEAVANGEGSPDHGKEKDEGKKHKQSIVKVIQNGYRSGERVIRPAKVTVISK